MFFQEFQKLLLKTLLAMMLLLLLDVRNGLVDMRNTDTERSVSFLPGETAMRWKRLVNPLGGSAFDQLNGFGDGNCGRERQQDVRVVMGPIHNKCLHFVLPGNTTDVWPKVLLKILVNQSSSSFGAKDAMHQVACV